MNKLHKSNTEFDTKRVDNDTLAVTIRTQDGVKMVYYGDSVDSCYAQYKQNRDSGTLGKEQAR